MRRWSRAHTLAAGLAIVAVTNIVALAGAAYNRSGTPEATLQLSERELGLPWGWGFESENSGVALRIDWRVLGKEPDESRITQPYYPLSSGLPGWLDAAKMTELGFDVASIERTARARSLYAHQLPREVLLVLELDGPAYHELLARFEAYAKRAPNRADELDREKNESSRLFVVDAGLDAEALRARYPSRSRYAIVRGTVRPWVSSEAGQWMVGGHVSGLSVSRINVPLAFRAPFDEWLDRRARRRAEALFTATVAFGRRFEPWMVSASGER